MTVIVDTISFSFQISALRDLGDFYFSRPVGFGPWPVQPESGDKIHYQELCCTALEDRMRFIFSDFFAMSLSPATGRGRLGYFDHCRITDLSGVVEFGYLAFGGNRDTAHCYLNGHACKEFFEKKQPIELHNFLVEILRVNCLNRLDLAYDDYSGATGFDSVIAAYDGGAFYCGKGPRPKMTTIQSRTGKILGGTTIYIGSRQSQVYWRSYDKNAEQGIIQPETPWWRHEAELKRISVDLLLDISAAYAGCNNFARTLADSEPVRVRTKIEKTAASLDSQIRWGRRLIGKTLRSLIDHFDAPTALALLTAGERGRLHLTPGEISTYRTALQI
ncbi:replication initiation factor domain-containing protein [Klebsiella michiganensis]|uniref:replication initiation factor domain-containing protein n=1 Tax=Klebsiella michiganensis TaxID=1134687 RepID=UPI0025922F8C|nr:replication initiation factor domain-containing protein [Klebsiella michiganensis]MDM4124314.1 replication initiation factor domain-containing protein [Klebsiella michiganensis]MDM4161148.1 replication initiation factor domain-containing protein [Klebsiella michiganensis]MDU2361003.1 replication initiation factor domain-containing protein [Klebsiella michiganensis]MDU2412278.1 replication initiation factor domain-containing protein [Klebsiella michiganensis]HDX9145300.1 replication initiati